MTIVAEQHRTGTFGPVGADAELTALLGLVVASAGVGAAAVEVGATPGHEVARWGVLGPKVVRVPLRYGNEFVGSLVVPTVGHRPHLLAAVAARLAAGLRSHVVARSAERARADLVPLEDGLTAALYRAARGAAVEVWPLPVMGAQVESAAASIATEALANAARHAPGAPARVRVRVRGPYLEVQVTDEGPGLPADFVAGSGVPAMRGRAAAVGGTCVVRRSVTGTLVEAMLPLGPHIPFPR
ncbi:sensor histidine kinase [Pseudonocardia oroxyli]|uniref:histidine kinase n=1 Tax=Pseudonocardia oroxyli TaxID=366584 RepID=A0A1G7G206_PSEOR|nr:ATP-binding protein [Pseudonocardia oroxyli]SDE82147.1 hypothetical protein SAMN05216377_102184 [Pseudonocardia oroxyli]